MKFRFPILIKAKRIRGFLTYFPNLDPSTIFEAEIFEDDTYGISELNGSYKYTFNDSVSNSIRIHINRKFCCYNDDGSKWLNPRAQGGLWYIEKQNYQYIARTGIEVVDPMEKNYLCVRFEYLNRKKYEDWSKRFIMVPAREAELLNLEEDRLKNKRDFILVESKSNSSGVEIARILNTCWREALPPSDYEPRFKLDRKILAGPKAARWWMSKHGVVPEILNKSDCEIKKGLNYLLDEGLPHGSLVQIAGHYPWSLGQSETEIAGSTSLTSIGDSKRIADKVDNSGICVKISSTKEADVPAEKYHALEHEVERLKALVVEQALEISELKRSKN